MRLPQREKHSDLCSCVTGFLDYDSPRLNGLLQSIFLSLRGKEHSHSLAFKDWHLLYLCYLFEVIGEAKKKNLALLLEYDRPAAEEDVGFNLRPLLDELLRMLELEVVVVVICLRAEANFLNCNLDLLCLNLLLLLLLLIEKLLVVEDFADRRIGGRRDFDKIKLLIVGHLHSLLNGIDTRILNVVSNKANLRDTDSVINPVFSLWLLGGATTLKIAAVATSIAERAAVAIGGGVHHAIKSLGLGFM